MARYRKLYHAKTHKLSLNFLTMITTYRAKNSLAYPGLIQKEITMNALFDIK